MAYQPKKSKKLNETELLIRGANMAASGIQEGYTPEQTLDMLMKYFQRQGVTDVEGYAQNSLNEALEFTPETAERTNKRTIEAEKAVREQSQRIEHRGTMVDPDSWDQVMKVADIEGRDQSDLQQWGGFDKDAVSPGGNRGRTASYPADRTGRIEAGLVPRSEMSDIERSIRDEAIGRATSGTGGVRDALIRLQEKIAEVGYAALPPETAEVERRLTDSLQYGKVQRGAERSLVRDMVKRENTQFSGAVAQENYLRAAEEAASYGWTEGGRGAAANDVLASIGEITRLGQVKAKAPFSVVPNSNVSNYGNAEWQGIPGGNETTGYYADPRTGQPVPVNEPASTGISGVNTPTSAQALNAPIGPSRYHVSQASMDWVTQNRPGQTIDHGGGLNFGNYPQVDIGRTTADFSARLQQLGNMNRNLYPGLVNVSPNVRSIGEFDNAINYIINQKLSTGKKFFIKDPLTGKQTLVATPGPSDVLRELGMSSTEEETLKNALIQLTLSEENKRKGEYIANPRKEPPPYLRRGDKNSGIVFDAPEAVDRSRGTAEIALIGKDKKLKNSNRTIRGLLNAIKGDKEVSKPLMGATADQGEPELSRQVAGGLDPTEIRWQAEQRQGRNQKLRPNPDPKAKQKYLSEKGEIPREKIQELRDYQVANALLRQEEISRRRASGESADFLTHNPRGRQSRPLPTRIPTSPAVGFVPDMNEGFDYEAWARRQQPTQQAATPPPPNKPPSRPAVATAAPQPWHRGRKRYIAGGAAGLGSIGLIANELIRRQQEEEQQQGVLR